MRVLGVYSDVHDLSVCLLEDGRLRVHIEEERLTRYKHAMPKSCLSLWEQFNFRFGYFPWAALTYCLQTADIGLDDLDAIGVNPLPAFAEMIPVRDRSKIVVCDQPHGASHHYHHALSAFLASPFERAAVLVVDGDGSVTAQGYEAESGYVFGSRTGPFEEVFKNRYSEKAKLRGGLGWMYEYISMVLGFVSRAGYLTDPGKTMGLAAYGQSDEYYDAHRWISCENFRLDFSAFHNWLESTGLVNLCNFQSKQSLIQSTRSIPQQACNLAYKVQAELESALLGLVNHLRQSTGERNLCLAGGTFLNSVANGKILRSRIFDEIFIQPAAADNGQAIGMAYHCHLQMAPQIPTIPMKHCFGGRCYPDKDILELLNRSELNFQEFAEPMAAAEDAAEALSQSQIIAWYQGGSEFGPRALGHRSILADPRGTEVKSLLNDRIKFREPFRPFAPAVMREEANQIFDLDISSPYMLITADVCTEWRERIPAVVHVDGTARIQTVEHRCDPVFYQLLSAFKQRTGVPLVLNTSFNIRGMPIVESPLDAIQAFSFTSLDALYISRFRVRPPIPANIILGIVPGWQLVGDYREPADEGQRRGKFIRQDNSSAVNEVPPRLTRVCQLIDGSRSLQSIHEALLPTSSDEENWETWKGIQDLLRRGILSLRLGKIALPVNRV
jgi:carbamoyltransferase